jgi:tetraacyldisaccharide 4'-kinase
MHLALALKERGLKPAVLTRGYGRDEVELMSRRLDSVPVVAGPDRLLSGRRAVEQFGADLLLLDDGFQQWRIRKDLDILAIDAATPFGNGHLIPRGTLREPKGEAGRADWIVVTKAHRKPEERTALEEELRRVSPGVPILNADYRPVGLMGWPSGKSVSLDALEGERICTLAGIARPESFEETVKRLGAELVLKVRVRDHHPYTVGELLRIFSRCQRHRIRRIVTTAKDAVRLPGRLVDLLGVDLKGMELWVLEIALEFESDESELLDRIGSLRAG